MQQPGPPPVEAFYSPPMRGRMAVLGLQGATVASLIYGGMPAPPSSTEPAGDLPQVDVGVRLYDSGGPGGHGREDYIGPGSTSFAGGRLPSPSTLDYVHKALSASLLGLALLVLVVYAVLRPRRALGLLESRAGSS